MTARILVIALALLAAASPAAAQLTGTVTRQGVPVEGAIVLLLSPDGREAARTASREAGRYVVSAPPGTYNVRVLQVGWRPTVTGPVALRSGASTQHNVDLVGGRLTLAAITVADRAQCTVRPDSSAVAFAVWDAARTSLLATALTRAEQVTVTMDRSERVLARDGTKIVSDSATTVTVRTLAPVRSREPGLLNDSGYVTAGSGAERMFWAPDAEVLLSDEFLATHCLTAIQSPSADSAALIGVRFSPATRRRDIVDVEGTLWLDRRSAELRALQYKYVNAPGVGRQNAGGVVEFLRVPRGRLIVHRWTMSYPIVAVRTMGGGGVLLPGLRTEANTREELLGFRVSSGSVLDIRRGDEVVWQRGRVSAAARVVDSSSAAPIPRAMVGIASSTDATATDANGMVRFDRMAPGDYTLRIRSPELASLGQPEILRQITIPDYNDAVITVPIPSARSIVATRCGERAVDWGEGMITGQLKSEGGRLVTASVIALSRTSYQRLGGGDPVVVDRVHEASPGVDGRFFVCGIPRDATVRVRKSTDAPGTGTTITFDDQAVMATVILP